jgi:hypothetical protein
VSIQAVRAGSTVEQLAGLVRGAVAPRLEMPGDLSRLVEEAAQHGVTGLLAHRANGGGAAWPEELRAALRNEIARGVALDAIRQREMTGVLADLAKRGVGPLLLKGTALAYTLYENPALRPRFDADLLVRREDMNAVGEVMIARGYARPRQVTGELVMHQLDYTRKDAHGVWHVYDFHWKLANRLAVADMLSYDELARGAVPIPALGPHARGLGRVHALMLACVHRVAHHPADDRLIWIHDIHLLCGALTQEDARALARLAVDRGVSAVCADGLAAAQRWFGTTLPDGLIDALTARPHGEPEASAVFLRPDGSRAEELLSDLRALPDWATRVRLLYEHAFPSPAYMSGMYTVSNRALLPALYAHRICRGAWKWFRRGPR